MIVMNGSTSSCTPSSMEGAGFDKGENLRYAVEVVHSIASVIAGCKSDVVRDKSSRRTSCRGFYGYASHYEIVNALAWPENIKTNALSAS